MSENIKGFFTDDLSEEEVSFSKEVAEKLNKLPWGQKLTQDPKILRALQEQPNPCRKYDDSSQIKSALFEVRFAHLLSTIELSVEYEAKTGIGNSSVDFKVVEDNNNIWLIELTSLRESNAVKKSTVTLNDDTTQYLSIDRGKNNSAEVLDLIKLQNAIYGKVTQQINNKIESLKFPAITKNTYHAVIVDARSFNAGIPDYYDFFIVVNGSHQLRNIHEGFCCRYFINQQGVASHILGIFEENNNDEKSKVVREKIHFICFTAEKDYKKNELIEKMFVFANPKYFSDAKEAKKIWLFELMKSKLKDIK